MKKNTRLLTISALMAAVSILLSYFEFPIIPGFGFLKLDFAEVPIMLCAISMGLVPAIGAEAVRSIVSLFVTGTASAGVGTAFNFILGILFVLLYQGYCHIASHRGKVWTALGVSSLLTIAIACVLNYVAVVPLYKAIGMVPKDFSTALYVWAGALPFNLIKWPLNAAVTGIIFQYTKIFWDKTNKNSQKNR